MIWVAWRQFRTQALVTLGVLVAFAVLVLVTGLHLHELYHSLGGAHCAANGDCTALNSHDTALVDLLGPALLAVPALLGMFWGAPLLAREFESGTYRLAWTQSITRRRWLSVRVGLVGISALAVAGLASWLVSWWFAPLDTINQNRMDPSVFTSRGIVAVGYAAFAFALGVAAGALARRVLPAIAATLFGFVGARIAVTLWIRPHLLSTREALVPVTAGKGVQFNSTPAGASIGPAAPPIPNTWTLSSVIVNRAQHTPSAEQLHVLLVKTCPDLAAGLTQNSGAKGPASEAVLRCQIALSHSVQQLVSYQPASHFWTLQALEFGIFLAAAAALLGATIWLVGRRANGAPSPTAPPPSATGSRPLAVDRKETIQHA